MAANQKLYNPEDPKDAELLRSMLDDDDEMDYQDELLKSDNDFEIEEGETGTNEIEIREESSDTEQSAESSSDENELDFFIGRDKIAGVKGTAREANSPIETWSCFITDDMLNLIVAWTNQMIESVSHKFQRERDAKLTDIVEMRAFLALLYLAGVLQSNRLSLEELWSVDGHGVEFFRLVMSIKRFKFLMRCLRFDDQTTRQQRKARDNLSPIRELFTMFVENFKSNYCLGQNVTIDEKLETFRELYAGRQPEKDYSISNKPSDVVKRLVTPIYNTGRNITADNWFTDVDLVSHLKEKKLSYQKE
ncbi:hypothetical protein NQ314_008374 [Rhamnusium bicolor]|uniref:PiggyBac transposable element-derived protein domain-containing protein n=1 Tax=Rhamnusium bicolor TaxID=1586634 RepID=A0AAV8YDF9_9CUCU|nr:hypothetical protein NQ314_008374 [Rhamnusium bicolor]